MKLRKNKKGFTLIEIIVVLVIMGILLAIAVPAILGYVNKARDAQYLSEARTGYLAAQTIVGQEAASNPSADAKALVAKITPTNVAKELNEFKTGDTEVIDENEWTNKTIFCKVTTDKKIEGCTVTTANGGETKFINFIAGQSGKGEVSETAKYTENTPK